MKKRISLFLAILILLVTLPNMVFSASVYRLMFTHTTIPDNTVMVEFMGDNMSSLASVSSKANGEFGVLANDGKKYTVKVLADVTTGKAQVTEIKNAAGTSVSQIVHDATRYTISGSALGFDVSGLTLLNTNISLVVPANSTYTINTEFEFSATTKTYLAQASPAVSISNTSGAELSYRLQPPVSNINYIVTSPYLAIRLIGGAQAGDAFSVNLTNAEFFFRDSNATQGYTEPIPHIASTYDTSRGIYTPYSFASAGGTYERTIIGLNSSQSTAPWCTLDQSIVGGVPYRMDISSFNPSMATVTITANIAPGNDTLVIPLVTKATGEGYLTVSISNTVGSAVSPSVLVISQTSGASVTAITSSSSYLSSVGGRVTVNIAGYNLTNQTIKVYLDGANPVTATHYWNGSTYSTSADVLIPANTSSSRVSHILTVELNGVIVNGVSATVTVNGVSSGDSNDNDNGNDDNSNNDGNNGENNSNNSSSQTNTAIDVAPKVNDSVATASVKAGALAAAIQNAVITDPDNPVVSIMIPQSANANTVEINIPADGLKSLVSSNNTSLEIIVGDTTLIFSSKALAGINSQTSGAITISIEVYKKSGLTATQLKAVGDRPVCEFTIKSGNTDVKNFNGTVTASIPYKPAIGENTNFIVVYYVDGSGGRQIMINSSYDSGSDTVSFNTEHFSLYMIGYNPVTFKDVGTSYWGKAVIEQAAARGIIVGMGDGLYNPDRMITKAEFVQLMCKTLDLPVNKPTSLIFADVAVTAWYYNAINSSQSAGLFNGLMITDNLFKPNEAIKREEMAVILANAAKYNGIRTSNNIINLSTKYKDFTNMDAKYQAMIKETVALGLMSGISVNEFDPKGVSTRAQAAQVLMNFIDKLKVHN